MQIKQLEYLMKIVECGSISQAAASLYISQPSLTKAIGNLEREYGIRIFNRKARGVELTMEGKEFTRYARKVLTAAEALDSNFIAKEAPMRSELFIAAHQFDFIYDCMLKTYEKFRDKNIHFNLIETDRNDVVRTVLSGKANLGFMVRNAADARGVLWNKEAKRLETEILDEGGFFACVGPLSRFYDRSEVSYEELNDVLQVGLDMEESAKQDLYFDNMMFDGYARERMIFFNTTRGCEHFVLRCDAVALVSKWVLHSFQSPDIRFIPVNVEKGFDYGKENELLLIKRMGEPYSQTERIFLDFVYEEFRRDIP